MADATEGLFAVPDLFGGAVAVCWSYGMGVESTCGVVRTLLEPDFRPAELRGDLSNLIVLVAQTGDEWTSTCDLVAAHVLPLLPQHDVRLVEVARKGPSAADGIVVLQDTRQPVQLHPHPEKYGFYALSDEHRGNGVLPTLGGNRTCSAKAKGVPLDSWRATHLGCAPRSAVPPPAATARSPPVNARGAACGRSSRAAFGAPRPERTKKSETAARARLIVAGRRRRTVCRCRGLPRCKSPAIPPLSMSR